MCLEDTLLLRNTNELVEKLEPFHTVTCYLLSLDIKDLYYSLNAKFLLLRLRAALERNLVAFQSSSGIAVDAF